MVPHDVQRAGAYIEGNPFFQAPGKIVSSCSIGWTIRVGGCEAFLKELVRLRTKGVEGSNVLSLKQTTILRPYKDDGDQCGKTGAGS